MKTTKENEFINKILFNRSFRTTILFYISIITTFSFAVFNAVLGIYNQSAWYGSIATYFIFLAFLRLFVFLYSLFLKKKNLDSLTYNKKAKTLYQINGVLIILLTIALSFSIVEKSFLKQPITQEKIMAITTATYTFLKITFAIINLVKDRKGKDIVFITIRNINLVDALVSILSLTVTLLTTFGGDRDYSLMIILVGVGVCLTIIFIGVFMLFDSRKILNKA